MTRRITSLSLVALIVTAFAAATLAGPSDAGDEPVDPGAVIRILPPAERSASGKTDIEALLIDPEIRTVIFYLDGEEVARRTLPPWEAKVPLASPAREQLLRVEALGVGQAVVGADEVRVNRVVRPLKVEIRAIEPDAEGLRLAALVSVPEAVELARVVVQRGDRQVAAFAPAELSGGELEIALAPAAAGANEIVRVVAELADGRTVEDARGLAPAAYEERLEVRLVQVQLVVTNKAGQPLKGLRKEHFEIKEGGSWRQPAGLFVASDVSLLLGFAVDSSGSMRGIWRETLQAATSFLDGTLTERDQGFLVDFDTRLRLVQPRTGSVEELAEGLERLEPEGGTALYDSILYSLLQFERQQGRRGLVVLTDGFDVDSKADPRRAVELGRKLGVPIYILALEGGAGGGARAAIGRGGGSRGVGGVAGGSVGRNPAAGVQTLRLLTDPTGGRLYRVGTMDQVVRALAQINAEMRNQYVLTYYTDDPPEPGEPPEIRVRAPGFKGLKVKAVMGADQVY